MEANSRELSERAFKTALVLNPMLYRIRTDYAELLLLNGEVQAASDILLGGIAYTYPNNPDLIPYYSMTIDVLKLAGKRNEAKNVEEKLGRQKQLFLTENSHPNTRVKKNYTSGSGRN